MKVYGVLIFVKLCQPDAIIYRRAVLFEGAHDIKAKATGLLEGQCRVGAYVLFELFLFTLVQLEFDDD